MQSRPQTLLLIEGEKSSGEPFIGFREEQSNASLIGAFMLARGVSRRRKVQIANFWLYESHGACSPTKSSPEP